MTIELSNLTFTEQDDIVPASGIEKIFNTAIANTLAGNDKITGESGSNVSWPADTLSGIFNSGTLNTDGGNDILTGIFNDRYTIFVSGYGIYNEGTIDTADGNDIITGINQVEGWAESIYNRGGTINTGNGNDLIAGITSRGIGIVSRDGTINTGDGDDTISGTNSTGSAMSFSYTGSVDTGNGNDLIIGIGANYAIANAVYFNTGDGDDTITGTGYSPFYNDAAIFNYGFMYTGDGNDIITGTHTSNNVGISNVGGGIIDTGDGNDIITGIGGTADSVQTVGAAIYNLASISTGNGNDSIISHGRLYNGTIGSNIFLGDGDDSLTANTDFPNNRSIDNFNMIDTGSGNDIITSKGVIFNEGTINTGNGADSIIADGGFQGIGYVSLGEGEDYLKSFGSGEFSGGNDEDRLELTPGTYTVGRWYTAVTFTKGSSIMIASEFEKLIAGSTN